MLQQYYPTPQNNEFMYTLNKDFSFSAAHRVPSKEAGKCANVHGHNYTVNLTIAGNELDESGFLANFGTLKKIVSDRYDHTYMNEHPEFNTETESYMFPTTEVVARQIYEIVSHFLKTHQSNNPECIQVILRETETSYVVFNPKGGI